MPEDFTRARTDAAVAEQTLARISAGLRAARLRTGLSEERVIALLGQQGLDITPATLQRWETTGLIHLDSASQLADAYGTTLDTLAGRRAFRQRHPTDDLPPAPRSAW